MRSFLHVFLACTVSFCHLACSDDDADDRGPHDHDGEDSGAPAPNLFVSSDTNPTGNLGGLEGADARCQSLADAAGLDGTWVAYLSTEPLNGDDGVDARDRIGSGPFYNVAGAKLADDVDALHSIAGDAELFLTENGDKVNGQWAGSPSPNEHDILTGTGPDGKVFAGRTCQNWTSDSADLTAQVGHSDGLGPNMNAAAPFSSWFSSHENGGCNDTTPRGGAGHVYCFSP